PQQRFSIENIADWTLIDDTYNANPLSSERMIGAAADLAPGRNLILVMGEMGELGEISHEAHHALGKSMGCTRAKAVFWKGGFARDVEEGLAAEHWRGKFFTLSDGEEDEFVQAVSELGAGGPVVLFKGSRLNRLELFLNALKARLQD
ncbi:MAG: UDP-N-acetylmuramoylalanyl-D-glutamyl-2, 6-diaminopimelate--D-alanyl-D-alanine ligase, partial [Desulfovibrionaceae bacterium]|nr:UDP-N-acetylmuramoylalanyl-D-glutamyl-2, 6-diaminopimelate--D-alanyl-D-alanine ligase [Desulfovibrionaceae bacterium]